MVRAATMDTAPPVMRPAVATGPSNDNTSPEAARNRRPSSASKPERSCTLRMTGRYVLRRTSAEGITTAVAWLMAVSIHKVWRGSPPVSRCTAREIRSISPASTTARANRFTARTKKTVSMAKPMAAVRKSAATPEDNSSATAIRAVTDMGRSWPIHSTTVQSTMPSVAAPSRGRVEGGHSRPAASRAAATASSSPCP